MNCINCKDTGCQYCLGKTAEVANPVEPIVMHVDDFIDDPDTDLYASWFLNMMRLPATLKVKFSRIIGEYKLFCNYDGKQYRVTGASRLGDIWLAESFDRQNGYDLRVNIAECTDFTNGA